MKTLFTITDGPRSYRTTNAIEAIAFSEHLEILGGLTLGSTQMVIPNIERVRDRTPEEIFNSIVSLIKPKFL